MIDKEGVILYGKHEGEHWKWLLDRHSSYLSWMVENVESIKLETKKDIEECVRAEDYKIMCYQRANSKTKATGTTASKTQMDIEMDIGCASSSPNFA
jgi:hypothetical protein